MKLRTTLLALTGLGLALTGATVPAVGSETASAGAPSRIILTPTAAPETSQSISWLGASAAESEGAVQVRPAAGGTVRTVAARSAGLSGGSSVPHFSVTVTGLTEGTAYTYRVGHGATWSSWQRFSTADDTSASFDYLYYGDAQLGLDTTWPRVVAMARAKAPAAVGSVHAGDLIDTGGNDAQWAAWFAGMGRAAATTNVMAAPGNHEYSGDRLLRSWKAHFEYPLNQPTRSTIGELAARADGDTAVARQYAAYFDHWSEFAAETVYFTDYQGVRFITLNATRDTTFLAPESVPACLSLQCPAFKVAEVWTQYQAAWLDHVLASSPSKWNVVTFHQPVYSASSGRDEPVLRKHWLPLFEKHDVDLVQMGHDHVYARGYKVVDGPVYVVSNAGAKHYDLAPADDNVWTRNGATQVKRGQDFSTFQVVSVSRNRLVYRSYLAEKTSSSTTQLPVGALWDELTIIKGDDGSKTVTEGAVAKQATSIRLGRVVLRRGRPGVVRVIASQAGWARVVLRRGERTRRTTVPVRAGRPAAARFDRVTHRGPLRARLVVRFVPADGASYAASSASRRVRIRR
ncbi:purple acid phosphatase family protein [Nocardioides pacificus]